MTTSCSRKIVPRRSRSHRAPLTLALSCAAALTFGRAGAARADDKATCAAAYETGQEMRNRGEFLRAREQLVMCARPTCKDWMVAECTKWLDELDRRQPTIVLTAENERGELIDLVKVLDESGRSIAEGATGRAIALDPGPHQLTFVARDGSKVVVLKMIQEGQQAVPIKAVFDPVKPAHAAKPAGPAKDSASPGEKPASSSPWRTAGFVSLGAGVVGLGVGTVFGLVALGKKSSANCDSSNLCDPGTTSGIEGAALGSTVGFVAGSVLVASGLALLVFGPNKGPERAGSAELRVTPVASPNGSSLVVGGSF
jgi:hypothetical protein